MDNVVDPVKGPVEPFSISYVAEKIPYGIFIFRKNLGHFGLFEFISAEDNEFFWLVIFQHRFCKAIAERACSACYKYNLVVNQFNLSLV
jgi:hypothetical protein